MQSPGHPPVENTFAVGFRARGLRLGSGATTQQLDLVETFFDVQAAATIEQCGGRDLRSAGDNARCTGTETQFKFRGTVQEEKPLRDWMREVLINCMGCYTFSFGKIKVGVRVNSPAVEAFTEGNILFRSLKLAPLKPSFNQITAHFADEDFEFVANSVAVYNVDPALLLTGGAGPRFLKSSVNLAIMSYNEEQQFQSGSQRPTRITGGLWRTRGCWAGSWRSVVRACPFP